MKEGNASAMRLPSSVPAFGHDDARKAFFRGLCSLLCPRVLLPSLAALFLLPSFYVILPSFDPIGLFTFQYGIFYFYFMGSFAFGVDPDRSFSYPCQPQPCDPPWTRTGAEMVGMFLRAFC
jgi:hypothetical protein